MPFIPHTDTDIREMLAVIGVNSIDALFDEIPPNLRAKPLNGIPEALNEMGVGRLMQERASLDGRPLNFIGAGAYEHHIPAAVWAIVGRGEFYSAYTPYQAEASQGTLQLLYEYQTMIASLTGMEVSNASLYDGASALGEACLMAVRAHRKSKSARILIPTSVNPTYLHVAEAVAGNQNIQFESVAYAQGHGKLNAATLDTYKGQDITALVIQQPNFFGQLEAVDALTDWAHANGTMVIAVVNPMTLALLKPPGQWGQKGVDIVVGDGQPLQRGDDHEIQRKQDNKDLAGVQNEQCRDHRRPRKSAIRDRSSEPARSRTRAVRTEKDLFRKHPREKRDGERRHSRPSWCSQPRFVKAVIKPRSEQEQQHNRSDSCGYDRLPGRFQRSRYFTCIHGQQNQPRDQQKAREIIALEESDKPKRNPQFQTHRCNDYRRRHLYQRARR